MLALHAEQTQVTTPRQPGAPSGVVAGTSLAEGEKKIQDLRIAE
jgi:hypothetical protein